MKIGEAFKAEAEFWQDMESISDPGVQERYLGRALIDPGFAEALVTVDLAKPLLNKLAGHLAVRAEDLISKVESVTSARNTNIPRKSIEIDNIQVRSPEQQQAEEWIGKLWIDFKKPMPRKLSPKKIQAEERHRARVLERALETASHDETGKLCHFMNDPYKLEALSNFGSQETLCYLGEMDLYKDPNVRAMQKVVSRSMEDYMRTNWKNIRPETLRDWAAEHVACEKNTKEVHGEALKQRGIDQIKTIYSSSLEYYFNAPRSPENRVEALYRFTLAIFEELKKGEECDLEVVRRMAGMATFEDPTVLNFDSEFYADMLFMQMEGFFDTEAQKRAINAFVAANNVARFFSRNEKSNYNMKEDSRRTSFRERQKAIRSRSIAILGAEEFERRRRELEEWRDILDQSPVELFASGEYRNRIPEDIYEILLGDDELAKLDREFLGSLATIYEELSEFKDAGGYKTDGFMSFPVDDGLMLDIFTPAGTTELERERIVLMAARIYADNREKIFEDHPSFQRIRQVREPYVYPLINDISMPVFGLLHEVRVSCRERVKVDDMINHPLYELAYQGLPEPILEEGKTLQDALSDLSDYIKEKYERVVPPRGVSVDITEPALKESGVEKVVFERGENSSHVKVSLFYKGKELKFELENFDIRPTDRPIASVTQLGRAIHLSLSLLKEFMCQKAVETSSGRIEGSKNAQALMGGGFKKYIPIKKNGQPSRRGDRQWIKFLEEAINESESDLDKVSDKRREEDPTGKRRNTTWQGLSDNDRRKPLRAYLKMPNYR